MPRNLLAFAASGALENQTLRTTARQKKPGTLEELVENSGLHSYEVLATLFDLEMQGVVRQLPGKQLSKVML
jgi:predicted Rossmann fold nucleotide-binding protein DprA/Smf involved in DNA uptake